MMELHEMNLNIRYDAPKEIWDKVGSIYEALEGWVGYDCGAYWFSFDEREKHVTASVEPSGIHFTALMEEREWNLWVATVKRIATEKLGYKVGEIESGEVDF